MTQQPYEHHIFQLWMHVHFKDGITAPVEEVRQATDDPLVHAVLDWLTLPVKPVDGQHRSSSTTLWSSWCSKLFHSLNDGGRWGVPRSGLTFQRRGTKLILVDRAPGLDVHDQQVDYELIKKHFASAGIEVDE